MRVTEGSQMRWLKVFAEDHRNRKERRQMRRAMIKRLRQQFAPRGSGRLVAQLDIYAVNKALKKAVA